ncbi:MAG: HNH endonuclease [Polyangiaceae bacterium]|nr:HNH endonuclease [Polyangiaceae bacterium]
MPRKLRDAVFARDAGRCCYCRLAQFGHGATFHIDHIIPRSKGGATSLANLALQCPNCSLHKANKIAAADPEGGESVRLFHPLDQRWSEHFRLNADGAIDGLTATGRATMTALGMNAMIPRFARACQLALGLWSSD